MTVVGTLLILALVCCCFVIEGEEECQRVSYGCGVVEFGESLECLVGSKEERVR